MRKIKVVGHFITLHSGRVRLDEKQARARQHGLKKVEGDTYEIIGPVGFKSGEMFWFDGSIGKAHAEDIEETRGPGRPSIKKPDGLKGGKSKKDKAKKPEETETESADTGTEEDDTNPDGSEEGAEGAGN